MLAFKIARVIFHIFIGVLTCAVIFPFSSEMRKTNLIRRWSKQLLVLCGVQLTLNVSTTPSHLSTEQKFPSVTIANHISWLDIFVLNAYIPCHFVAKSDIRKWPVAGWLVAQAGTVFLTRGKQREVRLVFEGLVKRIQARQRVAFFPEGTTSAQGELLPFHANLFEAALEAKVPVQAYAIRYINQNGGYAKEVDFIGDMNMFGSLKSVLSSNGIRAELIELPLIETEGLSRKELAKITRQAIAQELGTHENNISAEVNNFKESEVKAA